MKRKEKSLIRKYAHRLGIKTGGRLPELIALELIQKGHGLPADLNHMGVLLEGAQRMRPSPPKITSPPPNPELPPPSAEMIRAFYDSWDWRRLSYRTRKVRGARCECCGATPDHGLLIVCDHILPVRRYWSKRLEERNLQVLCEICNMGKGSADYTDWRRSTPPAFLTPDSAHP